ncbi:glycosyltransferase [Scytonema sp. UIC 10036]|uniref:glycosyltransferase n=1 Tax=Scytonema sp. UIC 10036 TaxID=2304196 RepID=UPI0012DA57FF|nr:glycosyltransferase [Scytonema sp. UIC 10036]MUG98975.1 glycosyltransferase [Scytonema sp. UIC 10036]
MKIWLVTMGFPLTSETFACNDVIALQRTGVKIAVHGLRPKHRLFSQLVVERGLTDIWITHNSIINTLHGVWVGLTQPRLLMNFILWILKHCWRRPINLFKSLILIPRSLQIYDFAQRHNPDIVHLYWSHFPSLVGYLIQNKLPKIVVSISFVAHDVYSPEFNSKNSYTGTVARNADLIQTITAANIPAIEKYDILKDKIVLSYHGVDFNKIPVKKEKVKRRIVTAGRLIPDKGFDDVLKAFSQVLSDWPDASLVILGDGPERKKLEALAHSLRISHAVNFRGFVTHNEIFEEMAKAEVFLFMSKAERLPNVVKEAMACHCLCVTSHTPGIEELVEDEVHGYIVQAGDIDNAARKIYQAFLNPEKMNQVSEIAYQHLKASFDLDLIIKNLQEQWAKIIIAKQHYKSI